MYAIYTHSGKTLKISVGIEVLPKDWELDHVKKSDPLHKVKNGIIEAKLQELRQAYLTSTLNNTEATVEVLRAHIRELSTRRPPAEETEGSLMEDFEKYLDSKKRTRAETTLSNINQTISGLREYEVKRGIVLSLQTLNKRTFPDLLQFYLDDCMYNDRTIEKHLKVMRGFLKWTYPEFNRSFITFKTKKDETVVHLTETELFQLINADLNGTLDKVRDLFVFSCLTGMRYSDLRKFEGSWLNEGVILYNQVKTSGLAVSPLFQNASDILRKHNFTLPRLSNPKYNLYLKDLFKKLNLNRKITKVRYQGSQRYENTKPLFEMVTTHVARKTFISLALANGIPIQDVMKMSGHSDYRGIRPYISVSKEHLIKVSKKWDI